ncbi:urease accessory protein UreE [Cylindrospermum stagnale PCC 7417]|uniref:Urease accessory protein UreE n=1 Tax=Cylindrospermum stagnale PCC 7417 TaxID=56107 RepID=K9X2C0_9NOST|nr:hypothetical protein [Cylindrospermum stagnale]AFZ26795.1 urease accessory protein UreE [Cylindrospermum stagnale PCC 7417]
MTELAKTYLGNLKENASLFQRIEKEHFLEVYLKPTDSPKGRIHTCSTSGIDIGIIKSRDWQLREGDVFATEESNLLLIHLQEQKVMVLTFNAPESDHRAIDLIHLGHVLGNHHWPILVKGHQIYIELAAEAEVIETTIRHFQIPGLQIDYEWRSPHEQLNFSQHTEQHHHH